MNSYLIASALLILCVLIVYHYFVSTCIYYTEQSLNQFRELQHEAMMHLTQCVADKSASAADIVRTRRFIQTVGVCIDNINTANHLNFRIVKKYIIALISCFHQINNVIKGGPATAKYDVRFWQALATSFRAIPFINARIFLYLVKLFFTILIKFGGLKYKRVIVGLDTMISVRRDVRDHTVHEHCLA